VSGPSPSSTDLVRQYLRDIGRVSLLSEEEDLTLAREVQRRERLLEQRGDTDPREHTTEAMEAWARRCALSLPNCAWPCTRGAAPRSG
jgi:DNA-directed RNA polymerase sigma subunit (sigma70/sigma32)